jgi:hypothetical protein
MNHSKEEIWKDIPGYEGLYQASDLGRVRSVERFYPCFYKDGKIIYKKNRPRILKTFTCGNGRKRILIKNKKGVKKHHYIHRLILETFIGPCPEGMEACHNDGNYLNNILSNLRWDTHKNNLKDQESHGTRRSGEKMHNTTISDEKVRSIIKDIGLYDRDTILKKYNIPFYTYYHIKSRERWKKLWNEFLLSEGEYNKL